MDSLLPILLSIIFFLLAAFLYYFYRRSSILEAQMQDLRFAKNSQSVRYGKTMEQWLPLSNDFPFSKKDFRFLGSPVDGIAFENDKIVFVEFKAADSQLSEKQKTIRRLVQEKKVEWLELNAK